MFQTLSVKKTKLESISILANLVQELTGGSCTPYLFQDRRWYDGELSLLLSADRSSIYTIKVCLAVLFKTFQDFFSNTVFYIGWKEETKRVPFLFSDQQYPIICILIHFLGKLLCFISTNLGSSSILRIHTAGERLRAGHTQWLGNRCKIFTQKELYIQHTKPQHQWWIDEVEKKMDIWLYIRSK